MIKPYGSESLNPLYVVDDARRAALMKAAEGLPSILISSGAATSSLSALVSLSDVSSAAGSSWEVFGFCTITVRIASARTVPSPSITLYIIECSADVEVSMTGLATSLPFTNVRTPR